MRDISVPREVILSMDLLKKEIGYVDSKTQVQANSDSCLITILSSFTLPIATKQPPTTRASIQAVQKPPYPKIMSLRLQLLTTLAISTNKPRLKFQEDDKKNLA